MQAGTWPGSVVIALALLLIQGSALARDAQPPGSLDDPVRPIMPAAPTDTGSAAGGNDIESKASAWTACAERPSSSYLDPTIAGSAPNVDLEALYAGWRASSLIGRDVYGRDGRTLGEVQDIVMGADARVAAITVESAGLLDQGEGVFDVPWAALTIARDRVVADLTEGEAKRRGLFDGWGRADMAGDAFRVTEVLGDWTQIGNETLSCPVLRGYVYDVVIAPDGRLAAVLESRSRRLGGGIYAYPFLGYEAGWRPHYGYYDLPIEHLDRPAPKIDLSRFRSITTIGAR